MSSRRATDRSDSPASNRRIGSEDSETRARLLEAAQALMLEGGHAAVTSRQVGAKAGLKPQLVHYYFRTMDDLFIAMLERGAQHNLKRQQAALASPQPLRALWDFTADPTGAALTWEVTSLAIHRPAIREQAGAYAEQFRQLQAEALSKVFADYGIDPDELPPVVLQLVMGSAARVLVMEQLLGVSLGHDETLELVERLLDRYEGPRRI